MKALALLAIVTTSILPSPMKAAIAPSDCQQAFEQIRGPWSRFHSSAPDSQLVISGKNGDFSDDVSSLPEHPFQSVGVFAEPQVGKVVVIRRTQSSQGFDSYEFDGSVKNLDSLPSQLREKLGYTVVSKPGAVPDFTADPLLGGAEELRVPTADTLNQRLADYNLTAHPNAKIDIRFYSFPTRNAFVSDTQFIAEYIQGHFPLRLLHEHLVHLPTLLRTPPEILKRHAKVIDKAYQFVSWLKTNRPQLANERKDFLTATISQISSEVDGKTAIYDSFQYDLGSIADRAVKLLRRVENRDHLVDADWSQAIQDYAKFLRNDPQNMDVPVGFRTPDELNRQYEIRTHALGAADLPKPAFN